MAEMSKEESATRDIFLAVYPPPPANKFNGLRAHWVVWVPSISSPDICKIIHVVGSPFSGYGLEIKRNTNIKGLKACFHLATIDGAHVTDDEPGEPSQDVKPTDDLEREAKKVEPPSVSKEPLNVNFVSTHRPCLLEALIGTDEMQGRRSQDWTREYLERLASRKIIPPESLKALDQAKALETQ